MRSGQASRTAEHNALFRTLEASFPAGVRLFDDPLAPALLTWPLTVLRPLITLPGGGRAVSGLSTGAGPASGPRSPPAPG